MENTLWASSKAFSLTDTIQWKYGQLRAWYNMCTQQNFSRWGGLLSFICGHNLQLQASGQYPSNRNCVQCSITCVHNTAIIIMTMEIFKLPTYQNISERIGCCKGQVQFSYHFTHFNIGCHDSPFHIFYGRFFFAGEKCPHIPWCWHLLRIVFVKSGLNPFCRACITHDVLLSRMDLKTVH